MDTTPAEAHARAHTRSIGYLGDDIDLRRLRVWASGGHYFADAVVAVPPGQAVVEGRGIADHIEAVGRRALPDIDVVMHSNHAERGWPCAMLPTRPPSRQLTRSPSGGGRAERTARSR